MSDLFHCQFLSLKYRRLAAITRCDLSAATLLKLVDSYLTASNSHNNVGSIQKNRGDKSHRVIVALFFRKSGQKRMLFSKLERFNLHHYTYELGLYEFNILIIAYYALIDQL